MLFFLSPRGLSIYLTWGDGTPPPMEIISICVYCITVSFLLPLRMLFSIFGRICLFLFQNWHLGFSLRSLRTFLSGKLVFQFQQLCHHFLRLRLLSLQTFPLLGQLLLLLLPLGSKLLQLFFLVPAEQADTVDPLDQNKCQEGQENTNDIARRRFQKLEKFPHTRQTCLIFSKHKAVSDHVFIVFACGRTVCNKSRISLVIRSPLPDFVGDNLSVIFRIGGLISNDVPLLQRGRIHFLHQYQIPGGLIELELTESIFFTVGDILNVKEAIRRMHELGFLCSLDDFGAGFSSLGLLKSFMVDSVKLDRSFFLDDSQRAHDVVESIVELARKLGIEDILSKYPYEVSGGQKQRAAVARALITQPKIVLADEPTGALDSRASDDLLSLFDEINRTGQTILMVTHSVKAASHAFRALFMKDGEIFHQLYRADAGVQEQYRRISDTLTLLSRGERA
mgnify:CR=1 FL=1